LLHLITSHIINSPFRNCRLCIYTHIGQTFVFVENLVLVIFCNNISGELLSANKLLKRLSCSCTHLKGLWREWRYKYTRFNIGSRSGWVVGFQPGHFTAVGCVPLPPPPQITCWME